jgi:nucleoporin p58/p45
MSSSISRVPHLGLTSAITTTLQSQHASFIALAARVAEVEASMDEVKQQFSTLYKARTGSALDPFSRTTA